MSILALLEDTLTCMEFQYGVSASKPPDMATAIRRLKKGIEKEKENVKPAHVVGSVSPWQPMTNKTDLKVLGKLGEELGEASAAVSRCIIQGIDECEPTTRKPNKEWLEDELADVMTNIKLVVERFGLDQDRIRERIVRKTDQLRIWHGME